MRRRASGSRKGTPFEREICKKLSLWWSGGESDNIFWRTATSGGRATVRHAAGSSSRYHHGDVCAIDPSGQPLMDLVTVEIKKGYSKDTVQDLLDKKKGKNKPTYLQWFLKAEQTAARAGTKGWLLIVMRDHHHTLAFFPKGLFDLNLPSWEVRIGYKSGSDLHQVTGIRLQDFFEKISPPLRLGSYSYPAQWLPSTYLRKIKKRNKDD